MDSFSLYIGTVGDDYKFVWSGFDSGEVWGPPSYQVPGGLLRQAADAVREQLADVAVLREDCKRADFGSLLRNLARRGRELYDQLMPRDDSGEPSDVRQRLEQSAKSGTRVNLQVRLDTTTLFIPWGFVFPGSVDQLPSEPEFSLAAMKGFWLSQFNISIAFGGGPTLPNARNGRFCRLLALHEDMFLAAKSLLSKKCLERLEKLLEDKPPAAMNWDDFGDSWKEVRDDHDSVIYAFGHSDGQSIQLKDGHKEPKWKLNAAGLTQYERKRRTPVSIFILNCCTTAAPTPISTTVPISANFLNGTRQVGHYGFIGTETQVLNSFACEYGTEFLWRMCKEGKSVGKTFDELLESKDLFPQNLLYTCYAERKFCFDISTAVEK
jgi:hypothetical protein